MLDVHYIGQTSFRYKTDIVITQQDLLGKLPSSTFFQGISCVKLTLTHFYNV